MGKTVTSTATITMTVETPILGSWGEECKIDQLLRQSHEAARNYAVKLGSTSAVVTDIKISFQEK